MNFAQVCKGDMGMSYLEMEEGKSSSRKLLLICLSFPPCRGGIQRFLLNLCNAYSRLAPLVVLAPKTPDCFKFDRLQLYPIYRYTSCYMKIKRLTKMAMSVDSLHVLASAYHLIKKEKIDIICCGEACLALQLPAAFLHSLFKIPWYSFVHGTDFLHVKRIWEQKLLSLLSRTASGILANSEYTRIKFVQFAGIDPNRTHVVHPGLDPLFIEKAITDERERINNNDYSILLTVGRLIDRKGQDMVIRALPKIINHVPKLKYRIIGEGPYRANLEKLAKELMVNEYVEFIGPVQDSDLIREYKSCDLFVMPSRESAEDIEGFGIVYLEASACGKPIIGGKSGGVSDAVLDNQTGILVDPTNIDEIANSVVNLLKNPLLAERLGKHGRERVLKKFTSNHMAIRILQIISESS